jgi:hypothetical protein
LETALIDVTEENLNKFTLADVVIPLVGHKTRFPKNEALNQIMFDLMAKDGLSITKFEQQA